MATPETQDSPQRVRLNLTFPVERVDQPLLAQAIRQFGVIADIRRAQIEPDTGGYIMLEMTGTEKQIDDSIVFFKSYGVGVGFIGSDEVQAY
ncbi:MAG: NIL domain-containing protein [Capsulimonadaceae bacterium]